MIIDDLKQYQSYAGLGSNFSMAFEFLTSTDLASLADGRHTLGESGLFAIVARINGVGRNAARLEVHRKYIDIQCVISGADEIGIWVQ